MKDINTASTKVGYHSVMVQLHGRAGKVMHADKPDLLKRLHYKGHLGGMGKMIEEDSSYIDVLRQTYVVRKAI